jgi:hypothetical protein
MRTFRWLAMAGVLSIASLGGGSELRTIHVIANVAWTDTGIDVVQGQELSFQAEGRISLQKGNPQAECGPGGYDLRTVQQPLPERNLGALIGKVVVAVTVIKDEKSGEERREEVAEFFYVGGINKVAMPTSGRLYLGVNELIVGDNSGEFAVFVETAPDSNIPYL